MRGLKVTINGIEEEFPGLRKVLMASVLKKYVTKKGGKYIQADIVIHDRPMPGWVTVKQPGYVNFIVVRADDWIVPD